jgi:hypothetical protein
MLLLVVIFFSYGEIDVKADSWAEPVRTETVRQTKKTIKVRTGYLAAKSETVIGKAKTTVTSTTKITRGKKVVTTKKTVTQNITKKKKGSRVQKITCLQTVTTIKDTYRYYYDLNTGISQNGEQNIEFNLNGLKKYLPQELVTLLKAQGVHIYLYSDHPILQKSGIVGVTIWGRNAKNAHIKGNQWYVILHETGHLLNCYAKESEGAAKSYYSDSEYFQKVFEKDRTKVQGSYSTSIREYFAESFMYYYLRPTKLKTERPDTYEAIRRFVESLQKS